MKGALARGAAPAAAPATGGGLATRLPVAQGRLRQVRPDRDGSRSRASRRSPGPALHRNWVMIPHVTNNEDADITELEAFRVQLNKENEKAGVKVTMLAFLDQGVRRRAEEVSRLQQLARRRQPDRRQAATGTSASPPTRRTGSSCRSSRTPTRRASSTIAKETSELAKQARDGKLKPADMQGGTFSISSLGGIGGTYVHADHQRARGGDPRRVAARRRSRSGTGSSSSRGSSCRSRSRTTTA